MDSRVKTMVRKHSQRTSPMKALFISAAAALALAAAPAAAKDVSVVINDRGELLEKLIKMDAAAIADMRADLADARADIAEAIADIADARREAESEAPFARSIMKIAFSFAGDRVENEASDAIRDALAALDDAEADMAALSLSDAERAETQAAIDILRSELPLILAALDDLAAALKG